MANTINAHTIEELRKFANDKGILEIVIRDKKKKYKVFQKVFLDNSQQNEMQEKVEQAINKLNQIHNIDTKKLNLLDNISKLNKLNTVLNGMNLFATAAGFAIMYAKLDKMSNQITEIMTTYKKGYDIRTEYEFGKILSEHSNMLDCRKKQRYYTEDQMRELVDGEYNVLEMLNKIFCKEITNDKEELLYSILSLAEMLAASIQYFDEVYYFNNKDTLLYGSHWHMSHDKWVSVFDELSSDMFTKAVQDYGIFDLGLKTTENDCLYISVRDQVRQLKQDIEDNQKLLEAVGDKELFDLVIRKTNEEVESEMETMFGEAGVPFEAYQGAMRLALA